MESEWNLSEVTLPTSLEPKLVDFYTRSRDEIWTACRVRGDRGQVVLTADQKPGPALGLAVDIGSTTLVMALVDLENPEVIEQITRPNPQGVYGADILTRAHFAEKNDGLDVLVGALRQAINQGVAELAGRCNIAPDFILAVSLAGNTTMTHFLLGLPVRTLIREPYVPVVNRPGELTAVDVGLEVAPGAPVLIMPNKGSYFGGDLMAGLVVSGLAGAEKPCMMVDVGTNAEVVLGQRDWLIGAAGAAGPALEGGVASMGMVAAPGAIDRVRIDRETGGGDSDHHRRCAAQGDLRFRPDRSFCRTLSLGADRFPGKIDFEARFAPAGGNRRGAGLCGRFLPRRRKTAGPSPCPRWNWIF